MKSLFLRIFLSFWMAQALFVVLAILVTLAFRPRGSSWEPLRTTSLNEAVLAYEAGGPPKVRQYLDNLQGRSTSARFCSVSRARKFLTAVRLTGRFGCSTAALHRRGMGSLFPRRKCCRSRVHLPMGSIDSRW